LDSYATSRIHPNSMQRRWKRRKVRI
jgi:hypothetical protein